jgi:hypothetical protein
VAEQNAEGWRKASYSGTGGGDCAEVGQLAEGVAVRDTKNRDGITLGFSAAAWQEFVTRLQS